MSADDWKADLAGTAHISAYLCYTISHIFLVDRKLCPEGSALGSSLITDKTVVLAGVILVISDVQELGMMKCVFLLAPCVGSVFLMCFQ